MITAVEELRQDKAKLESDIQTLIDKFAVNHGTIQIGIDVVSVEINTMSGVVYVKNTVEVNLTL